MKSLMKTATEAFTDGNSVGRFVNFTMGDALSQSYEEPVDNSELSSELHLPELEDQMASLAEASFESSAGTEKQAALLNLILQLKKSTIAFSESGEKPHVDAIRVNGDRVELDLDDKGWTFASTDARFTPDTTGFGNAKALVDFYIAHRGDLASTLQAFEGSGEEKEDLSDSVVHLAQTEGTALPGLAGLDGAKTAPTVEPVAPHEPLVKPEDLTGLTGAELLPPAAAAPVPMPGAKAEAETAETEAPYIKENLDTDVKALDENSSLQEVLDVIVKWSDLSSGMIVPGAMIGTFDVSNFAGLSKYAASLQQAADAEADTDTAPEALPTLGTLKITASSLNVRETANGAKLGAFKRDELVTVVEAEKDGWVKVKSASGLEGYVSAKYTEAAAAAVDAEQAAAPEALAPGQVIGKGFEYQANGKTKQVKYLSHVLAAVPGSIWRDLMYKNDNGDFVPVPNGASKSAVAKRNVISGMLSAGKTEIALTEDAANRLLENPTLEESEINKAVKPVEVKYGYTGTLGTVINKLKQDPDFAKGLQAMGVDPNADWKMIAEYLYKEDAYGNKTPIGDRYTIQCGTKIGLANGKQVLLQENEEFIYNGKPCGGDNLCPPVNTKGPKAPQPKVPGVPVTVDVPEDIDTTGSYLTCDTTTNLMVRVMPDGTRILTSTPCPDNPTTCFPAGTKVSMADGTNKNIEEVVIGEMVVSYDEKTGENKDAKVLALHAPKAEGYYEINKDLLKVTDNHPIYVTKADGGVTWAAIDAAKALIEHKVEAVTLEIGDQLHLVDGTLVAVESFELVAGEVQVYNLSNIDNHHTFYADGVLVHNKGEGCCGGASTGSNSSEGTSGDSAEV